MYVWGIFTLYQRTTDIANFESMQLSHGAVQGQYFFHFFFSELCDSMLQAFFTVIFDTLTCVPVNAYL